jgi:hypothetical protein
MAAGGTGRASGVSSEDEILGATLALSEKEQDDVEEGQRPKVPVVYEIVRHTAWKRAAVLTGLTSFYDAALKFFLPVLAGNVFGGTVLFSVLSYAQAREEIFLEKQHRLQHDSSRGLGKN